jgi:pyridoxine 5'-phosphate synthase PdxJ
MSYVDVELKTMRIVSGKHKKDDAEEQGQDATLPVIKSLMDEEVCLTEQRDELLTLKGGLELQAKEKIETVTSSIQKLKNEVSELRIQREQLKEFISNSK